MRPAVTRRLAYRLLGLQNLPVSNLPGKKYLVCELSLGETEPGMFCPTACMSA